MADYPFKINITTKDDLKYSFYTASLATDADTVVSASVMVDRINNMKLLLIRWIIFCCSFPVRISTTNPLLTL